MRARPLALLAAVPLLLAADPEPGLNGFRLESLQAPRELVRAGGPDRDAIPRVDAPVFVAPSEATWVVSSTSVVGLALEGEAHVYPVHLMEYHQLVNDVVGRRPVVVTYDPLTATPRAYLRELGGRRLRFGVSGLVYNSGFLLYDLETESLWSQFRGDAIAGELAGKHLERLRVRQETLARWLERHPESRVMTRPTPERIDYRYSPYKAYWLEDRIPFPVGARDERFHAKELVLGVVVGDRARAYLGSQVTRAGLHVDDELAGRRIVIDYDPDAAVFVWEAPEDVRVTDAYWFAWKAFHPDTEVWEPPSPQEADPGLGSAP